MGMRKLIEGHATFRADYVAAEQDFLRRLASEGQSPDALFIGCSDSRVVPELLTTSSPGSLFVVRNVANAVPPLDNVDSSVGAALEYATVHLNVPHIIVCGHYGCGGVKAALQARCGHVLDHVDETPSLAEWLQNLAGGIEPDPALDAEAQWRAAVEDNVLAQMAHLTTFPAVRERLQSGRLQLHSWVYDIYAHGLKVYDVGADRFVDAARLL
jgi:carbonic anhydrase